MIKTYHGRLRLEVSVPEKQEIATNFKGFVEFPIYCPKCGIDGDIKKNGFDYKHSNKPQLFYCNSCHTSFYPHTSWIFEQLAEVEWDRILDDLFIKKINPKNVAILHKIHPSFISKIFHDFTEITEQRLSQIAIKRQNMQNEPNLPIILNDAIWWDEMFFNLGKVSWCLILLVDARGRPLVWKFGKTRTQEDYTEVLKQLGAELPEIPIFIGDAWSAYQKTCRMLKKECFLIEHVHSHPWKDVRLHYFKPDLIKDELVQTSINITYNSFLKNKPVKRQTFTRKYSLTPPIKSHHKRGRPKGSKDKTKRMSRKSTTKKSTNKSKNKRGPKSIVKHGREFSFFSTPFIGGWHIEWFSPPLNDQKLLNSSINEIELLLDITYKIMDGGYIQSNRIEGKNREVRVIVPNRGSKTPLHIKNIIDLNLKFWSCSTKEITTKDTNQIPVTSSLAFKNIFSYFSPSVAAIDVISANFV